MSSIVCFSGFVILEFDEFPVISRAMNFVLGSIKLLTNDTSATLTTHLKILVLIVGLDSVTLRRETSFWDPSLEKIRLGVPAWDLSPRDVSLGNLRL